MIQSVEFKKAVSFIAEIGIKVHFNTVSKACFLPGLSIENGELIVNTDELLFPGDILHEAGHIAVVPAAERKTLNADSIAKRPDRGAEEMMAIAWSYAACVHLQLDGSFVFHETGYNNGGTVILGHFNEGRYFGVPTLHWLGMTNEKDVEGNGFIYPKMKMWLRK